MTHRFFWKITADNKYLKEDFNVDKEGLYEEFLANSKLIETNNLSCVDAAVKFQNKFMKNGIIPIITKIEFIGVSEADSNNKEVR